MGTVTGIKNAARAGKQLANKAKDLGQSIKLGKAILDGSKSKISNPVATLMIALAISIDVFIGVVILISTGLIGFVVPFVWPLAWLIFFIWFKILGISFFGTRQVVTQAFNAAVKLVPMLNALPTWTPFIVLMIAFTRMEEAGGTKASDSKQDNSKVRTPSRGPAGKMAGKTNVLNNKRSPEEQRTRFQAGKAPDREQSSTPRGGVSSSNVLNLKGQGISKAA